MPERFECTTLAIKALYKYSSFPFTSFTVLQIGYELNQSTMTHIEAIGRPQQSN